MLLLRVFSAFHGRKSLIFEKKHLSVRTDKLHAKGHLFCKPCLHDLQFMKTRFSSPNLSKLARADISCQFIKTKTLPRHCLQNEWTLSLLYIFLKFSWSKIDWSTHIQFCVPKYWASCLGYLGYITLTRSRLSLQPSLIS